MMTRACLLVPELGITDSEDSEEEILRRKKGFALVSPPSRDPIDP
jgi:hypothetical protein